MKARVSSLSGGQEWRPPKPRWQRVITTNKCVGTATPPPRTLGARDDVKGRTDRSIYYYERAVFY